jgi:transcriptional regulator with XRE-family HTH domain
VAEFLKGGTPMDLADKLNLLFEKKRKRDGSSYTQEEVIQGTHGVLTRAYLWKLRTGRAENPGFKIVQALADFFAVDLNYFRTDADQPAEIVEKSLRDDLLNELLLRANMYSDETIQVIIGVMEYVEANFSGKSEI